MADRKSWKLLVETSDESEAYLVKGRLESEGIGCRIEISERLPAETDGGRARKFMVQVAVSEFEASQQVLEEDLEEEF